jgi:hypothetical protein
MNFKFKIFIFSFSKISIVSPKHKLTSISFYYIVSFIKMSSKLKIGYSAFEKGANVLNKKLDVAASKAQKEENCSKQHVENINKALSMLKKNKKMNDPSTDINQRLAFYNALCVSIRSANAFALETNDAQVSGVLTEFFVDASQIDGFKFNWETCKF